MNWLAVGKPEANNLRALNRGGGLKAEATLGDIQDHTTVVWIKIDVGGPSHRHPGKVSAFWPGHRHYSLGDSGVNGRRLRAYPDREWPSRLRLSHWARLRHKSYQGWLVRVIFRRAGRSLIGERPVMHIRGEGTGQWYGGTTRSRRWEDCGAGDGQRIRLKRRHSVRV